MTTRMTPKWDIPLHLNSDNREQLVKGVQSWGPLGCSLSLTHVHTNTYTQTQAHTHPTNTHLLMVPTPLALSLSHTHTQYIYTHTLTQTYTHIYIYTQTHTHTYDTSVHIYYQYRFSRLNNSKFGTPAAEVGSCSILVVTVANVYFVHFFGNFFFYWSFGEVDVVLPGC